LAVVAVQQITLVVHQVVATVLKQSVQQLRDKEILVPEETMVVLMFGPVAVAVEQVLQVVQVPQLQVEMVVQEQHGLQDSQLQLQLRLH
jgi:hypothetical protein